MHGREFGARHGVNGLLGGVTAGRAGEGARVADGHTARRFPHPIRIGRLSVVSET